MAALETLTVALKAQTSDFTAKFGDAGKVVRAFEKAANDAAKAERYMEQAAGGTIKTLRQIDQEARAAAKAQRDLERAARSAAKELERQENAARRASSKGGHFSAVRGIATEMNSFLSIVQRAYSALSSVYDLAEEGARAATAEKFFINAGKAIDTYRAAAHGLISDTDLMKKANLADSMGLTEDTFKTLVQVATAAAAKTGQSFDHMFDSIIVGTARSSRLLLDNLGIIVSVKEANENYARSLKEGADAHMYTAYTVSQLADALSDEAKKIAFAEEVMRKSKKTLVEYKAAGVSASETFDKFKAAIDNLKIAIGKTLAGALQDSISDLTEWITKLEEGLNLARQAAGLRAISGAARAATAMQSARDAQSAGGIGGTVSKALKYTFLGGLGSAAIKQATPDDGAEAAYFAAIDETTSKIRVLSDHGIKLSEVFKGDAATIRSHGEANFKLIMSVRALDDALLNMFETTVKAAPAGGRPGVDADKKEKGGKGPKDTHDADLEAYFKKEFEIRKQIAKEADALAKADAAAVKAVQERQGLEAKAAVAAAEALAVARKHLSDLKRDLIAEETARKQAKQAAGVVAGIGIAGAAASGDAQGAISGILGQVLGEVSVFGVSLGPALGDLIGQMFAPLEGIGVLFDGIAKGAASLMELGFGPLIDTLKPLGPALEFLLASVGHLIGSALAPFLPIVGLIISGIAGFIDIVALIIVVLSPVVEAFVALAGIVPALFQVIWSLVTSLFGMDTVSLADIAVNAAGALADFANTAAGAAVWMNNAMVNFVRGIGTWLQANFGDDFGMSDFGEIRELGDILETSVEATEDNTDKTADNTKAVRDLTREFRNLPSGYKVNSAIYNTTAPGRPGQPTIGTGNNQLQNRDMFRGRL